MTRTDAQPTFSAHYYFSDHLGSANVVTNATGGIEEESDCYPYGGERVITNLVPRNYKFTGKERDAESGLDNFGARYNASTMGRFMSPDPLGGKLVDPQTLNRYCLRRKQSATPIRRDSIPARTTTISARPSWTLILKRPEKLT